MTAQATTSKLDQPPPRRLLAQLPVILLGLIIIGYIGAIMLLHVVRFNRFFYGFDLAFYQQSVWNTLQGRFLEVSATDFSPSLLGTDVILILLVMTPFYAIFPSFYTLLAFETVVVALGAIPVYWLARNKLGSRWAGVGMALVYLFTLSVQNGNLYELRFRPMVTTFLLFAFYYYINKRLGLFTLFAVLALMCRPENGLLFIAWGVYGFTIINSLPQTPNQKNKKEPRGWEYVLVPLLLGLVWFVVAVVWIIPGNTVSGEIVLGVNYPGNSPVKAVTQLFTDPAKGFGELFNNGDWLGFNDRSKLLYLVALLLPFLFLPLLSPSLLLMVLPPLALNLLSLRPLQWNAFNYHYQGSIVAWLVIGTIYSIAKLSQFYSRQKAVPILMVGLVLVATLVVWAFGPNQVVPSLTRKQEPRWEEGKALIAQLPDDVPLAISNLWAARVPPRQGLWLLKERKLYSMNPLAKARYVFANLRDEEEAQLVAKALQDPAWEQIGMGGDYVLLRHK